MESDNRLVLYDAKQPLQLIQCSPSTRTLYSVCECKALWNPNYSQPLHLLSRRKMKQSRPVVTCTWFRLE